MATQLRSPNLNTTDLHGWCLRLVLHAYGFNTGADFARQEWDRNTTKHTDALPDVMVPVFYSWTGTIDGITRDWGDVAIWVPGRGVFGTPQRGAGNSNRWDASVEARRAWLGGGAQYLGWTEQLNGTQLVQLNTQGGSMTISIKHVDKVLKMGLRREPTAEELNNPAFQNSPELLIDTVWNNGGGQSYEQVKTQIFNEGDRKNVNIWLYGEDKLLYPAAIGMQYKDAIGAIFTSKEYADSIKQEYVPYTLPNLYVKKG